MSITIYGRRTCAPCKTLMTFMVRRDIPFSYVDVDQDQASAQTAYELGGAMVPITLVENDSGKHVIRGLNLSALTSLL